MIFNITQYYFKSLNFFSAGAGLIGMQSGHNMGGNGGSSQSPVLANSGATSRSGASYGYNLHPGAQAATMPVSLLAATLVILCQQLSNWLVFCNAYHVINVAR